jgi:flagellin-like protein
LVGAVDFATGVKMRALTSIFGVLVAVAITLAAGAIHGRLTNRWGLSENAVAAGRRLEELPSQFGPSGRWQLQASEELDATSIAMLQPAGYILRRYRNQETGDSVQMVVLLGQPAPISVHTPEICYSSRNYDIREDREEESFVDAKGKEHQFWGLTFRSHSLNADILRVYYGWSTGSRWVAATHPRMSFARQPYLYKIQLAGYLPPSADPKTADPCRQFIEDLLPALKEYMVEPSSASQR